MYTGILTASRMMDMKVRTKRMRNCVKQLVLKEWHSCSPGRFWNTTGTPQLSSVFTGPPHRSLTTGITPYQEPYLGARSTFQALGVVWRVRPLPELFQEMQVMCVCVGGKTGASGWVGVCVWLYCGWLGVKCLNADVWHLQYLSFFFFSLSWLSWFCCWCW